MTVEWEHVAPCPYPEALSLMQTAHRQVCDTPRHPGFILSVEHPPTITMGKRPNEKDMHVDSEQLKSQYGVDFFKTDRGGSVTVHEPGQLVVYPILSLKYYQLGVKEYVHLLENTVIQVCAFYGIEATTDPAYPGVWVMNPEPRKIAAISIRVENHVSRHGLALNICNTMDTFRLVTPCGIAGRGVTSLSQEKPQNVFTVEQVLPCLQKILMPKLLF